MIDKNIQVGYIIDVPADKGFKEHGKLFLFGYSALIVGIPIESIISLKRVELSFRTTISARISKLRVRLRGKQGGGGPKIIKGEKSSDKIKSSKSADPWTLYLYAMSSPATKEKYLIRLGKFLNSLNLRCT